MVQQPGQWQQQKREIRGQARANRLRQTDKAGLSRLIRRRFLALPEYVEAATVMLYLDQGPEVRTRPLVPAAWKDGKRVVVPYCAGDRLELFRLDDLDELFPGAHAILEPKAPLRSRADRKAQVAELDLILVPGVAFDRQGGRLGQGKGYYDRLLCHVRPGTALIGLAFECQLVPRVPMLPHDVFMHKLITEKAVYVADSS
jgi:5-formyltetrahydrofolate cyclo-ligase